MAKTGWYSVAILSTVFLTNSLFQPMFIIRYSTLVKMTSEKHSVQSGLETIEKLPLALQSNYVPFLLGNDTPLTCSKIVPYQMNENFVLIGTALFRSIDIACWLTKNKSNVIPTVIIIDHSRNTSIAWQQIKAKFASVTPSQNINGFLHDEDGFLDFLLELRDQNIIQIDNNLPYFFSNFFKRYPLEYVKQIVAKVKVIEQDWAHADTFSKLKVIYQHMPVVAYCSNIIDYVAPETQVRILRNLEYLNPCVSFCTNLDKIKRLPTISYVFSDSSARIVSEALQLSDAVKACVSTDARIDNVEDHKLRQDKETTQESSNDNEDDPTPKRF